MNNYEDRFDCDPADCNIGSSMSSSDDTSDSTEEYSVDTVETTTNTGSVADSDTDSEAADDFGVDESTTDETAATDLGTSDDGTTGDTDLSNLYEVADAQDSADSETSDSSYDTKSYRWSDSENADETAVDPSDETAATCDSDCDCGTTYAQKKCSLDDYEIISDVLGCEKQLVKLYSTALCESSEEPLRDIIKENLIEAAADQFATFEYMEKRGMYETEQADEQKVLQAKEQFCPLCD